MSFFFCLSNFQSYAKSSRKEVALKKKAIISRSMEKMDQKKPEEEKNWLKVESLIVWRHAIYQSVLYSRNPWDQIFKV